MTPANRNQLALLCFVAIAIFLAGMAVKSCAPEPVPAEVKR
jgi:hypothetical protein